MPPIAAIGAIAGGAIGGGALTSAGFALGSGALTGAVAGASLGSMLGGGDDYSKISQAQNDAITQADQAMANAQVEASRLLAEGNAAQAAAIIEGAKISAKAVMDAAQLAVDAQERFFAIADQKLEPFRQQGLNAGYEMASMLGIPNADGEIVPYDLEKLRSTPGFNFVFEQGQKALDKSAVGTKLSGAQAKAAMQYGQGMGDTYFQQQFNNLASMYNTGANAAGSLAQAAVNTGGNIGNTYSNQGNQLSNIYGNQATSLANIASANSIAQANLVDSYATNQANLALARGAQNASLYAAQQNSRNQRFSDLLDLGGILIKGSGSKGPTTSSGGGGYGPMPLLGPDL